MIEGVDRVGKSTVYKAYRKLTNYGPLVIDRFLASNFTYDIFFERNPYLRPEKFIREIEKNLMKTFDCVLLLLVNSDRNELRRRMEDDGKVVYSNEEIDVLDSLYYWYCRNTKFRCMIIDGRYFSPEEIVSRFLDFSLSKKHYEERVDDDWTFKVLEVLGVITKVKIGG